MPVKDVTPGGTNNDNPLAKKTTRDIGSVGLEELVSKISQKITEKVEKVDAKNGSAEEVSKSPGDAPPSSPELKKAYFNRVGVEKNFDTAATRALRGGASGIADARNLKLVVLPKCEKMADPNQIGSFGGKANIAAPFAAGIGDILGRTLKELEAKPERAQKRMAKLTEKQKAREKKFGKKVVPLDKDPNEFSEEEYERQKKDRRIVKMFDHMNKALGQKMDLTGAPPALVESLKAGPKKKPVDDDDD